MHVAMEGRSMLNRLNQQYHQTACSHTHSSNCLGLGLGSCKDYSNVLNPIGFFTTYKKLWKFLTCTYMYHGGDPRYNISNTSLSLHVAGLCVLFKHFFISIFLGGICNHLLLSGSLLVLLVSVLMWIDNWERCLKCKSHLVVKKLVMLWNKPWKNPSPCR
jgi:hypothetical protein